MDSHGIPSPRAPSTAVAAGAPGRHLTIPMHEPEPIKPLHIRRLMEPIEAAQ